MTVTASATAWFGSFLIRQICENLPNWQQSFDKFFFVDVKSC